MPPVFRVENPTQSNQPQSPKSRNWGRWFWVSAAGIVGCFGLAGWVEQQNFDEGMQALTAGDCVKAVSKFDQVIGDRTPSTNDPDDIVARAQAKKAECQAFQAGTATKESPANKFKNAAQFVQKYPNSELINPLKQAIVPIVQQTDAKNLVTLNTCQRLEVIKTKDLVANNSDKLPQIYQACGDLFASSKNLPQAIAVYEKFLDQFPNHPLGAVVKQSYAKAIVKDAKAQGGGTISSPGQVGYTADGSTVVSIRNDSTEAMRIVFSGPTPRVEELAPCKDCQEFTAATLPKTCPNKGPEGTYTVQAGTYEVMVKSVGDRVVKPFTGSWTLDGGSEYSHCFYIVRDPLH